MVMKNMGTSGLARGVADARDKARPSAAKPTIPVRNGGGMGGGMSLAMGKACSSLKRQGEGREGRKS